MKKLIIKNSKLEKFKTNIKRINNIRNSIEKAINEVIKELEEKISLLKNLEKEFMESLDMKLKYVDLVFHNYEQKMKDFDINFVIINNLANQINFKFARIRF